MVQCYVVGFFFFLPEAEEGKVLLMFTTEGLFGAHAPPVFALVSVVYQSQTDFEEPLEVGLNGSSCIALEFKC